MVEPKIIGREFLTPSSGQPRMTSGMIPATWDEIRELVADALDVEPSEQEQLVASRAGRDSALFREAMSLLHAAQSAQGVIDPKADEHLGLGGPDVISMRGQAIGRYRLEELVGEGAMSAVYRAWQTSPKREVAIKLFRSSMAVVDARARFNREAQALARLSHPNIATIYESGLHPLTQGSSSSSGSSVSRVLPFIAMEFVRGSPVTEYASAHKLLVNDRVKLMVGICRAVAAAHQQAVIHCDLKPANVLVQESTGQPKVLDFGIARITAGEVSAITATAGVLLGTPGYMSPEQASSTDPTAVDTRSDVWALGVMLFELLSGKLPIELDGLSVHQTLRKIEQAEPRKLRDVVGELPIELQTICEVAMSKEKSQRFSSADAMADDLERFLRHEPLKSRPPGTWAVVRKFTRRHWGKVLAACASVLVLAASSVVSSIGFVRADFQRQLAEQQRNIAQAAELRAQQSAKESDEAKVITLRVNNFLLELLKSPLPDSGGRTLTVYDQMQRVIPTIGKQFADAPIAESDVRKIVGRTLFQMGEYEQALEQFTLADQVMPKESSRWLQQVVDIRTDIAQTYRWLNEPGKASKVLDDIDLIGKPLNGTSEDMTTRVLSQRAGIANDIGENDKAIELYTQLIELHRRNGDTERGERLTAQNNMSNAYSAQGRYQKSIEVLEPTVKEMEEMYGKASPSTLTARSNLAYAYGHTGQFEKAAAEFELLGTILLPVLGPAHPDVLNNRRQFAMLSDAMGNSKRALEIGKQLSDIADSTLSLPVGERARNKWLYSLVLGNSQQFEPAIAAIRQYLELGKQDAIAKDDLFTGRLHLAELLSDSGDWQQALPLLNELMDEFQQSDKERLFVEPNLNVVFTKAYLAAGQLDKADVHSARAIELVENMGKSKARVAVYRARALTLIRLGKPTEALPYLELMDQWMQGVGQIRANNSARAAWEEYRQAAAR
jgi:eukaryotic-like serine/threonine-protein kinase